MIVRFLLLVLVSGTSAQAEWLDHRFNVMGTEARVRLWHADPKVAQQAVAAVEAEMRRIDRAMSPYIKSSELAMINRTAASRAVHLSREMLRLVQQSIKISKFTQGAFDISFSSVGYLYNYRRHIEPDPATIERAKKLIDYRSIVIDQQHSTIRFLHPGMRIDLGGIAKGYAVDQSIAILRKLGVTEALVTAGGDSFALGNNGGKLWRVGIKHPRISNELVTVVPLEDAAISTSGDYERFFIDAAGNRVHHIINPLTGRSAKLVQSATIIANNSTFADALSTSVFILGPKRGMALVESLSGVSAIIVDAHGKLYYSKDLAPR